MARKAADLMQAGASSPSFVTDEVFYWPRTLYPHHVRNCRVLANRRLLLTKMPKRARVAELGTQAGLFSKWILDLTRPRELHLFDLTFDPEAAGFDREYFAQPIQDGTVVLHEGDSSTRLAEMPDRYFDWIYIDADHTYAGVLKDINVAKRKIKRNGYLIFNDYTVYSPLELMQYGIPRAVNDLCIDEGYELVYLALHVAGYHDVCVRKRRAFLRRGASWLWRKLRGTGEHGSAQQP